MLLLSLSCSHIPCPHTRKITLYSFLLTKLILLSIFRYLGFLGTFWSKGTFDALYYWLMPVTMFCTSICLWQPKQSPPLSSIYQWYDLGKRVFQEACQFRLLSGHSRTQLLVPGVRTNTHGTFSPNMYSSKKCLFIFIIYFCEAKAKVMKRKR